MRMLHARRWENEVEWLCHIVPVDVKEVAFQSRSSNDWKIIGSIDVDSHLAHDWFGLRHNVWRPNRREESLFPIPIPTPTGTHFVLPFSRTPPFGTHFRHKAPILARLSFFVDFVVISMSW
ncbi:hypothetical protein E2542_SST17180 [Spatholobus suberectus]|nr:hypothetical protein E2542_SST17180 [Spatholobus suberectus]